MRYFDVLFEESAELGVGKSDSTELLLLSERGVVEEWRPVRLELIDGGFPDYLASDLGLRICSLQMRQILDAFAAPFDSLQWLPVSVAKGADCRQYWALHFPQPVDALADRSIRVRDFVVKAVFRASGLVGHAVFTYAGAGALPLTVSHDVKDALLSAGCTGFECAEAAVDP